MARTKNAPSKIVEGVGVATWGWADGVPDQYELAQVKAIRKAYAAGVTDADEISKRMKAAREKVRAAEDAVVAAEEKYWRRYWQRKRRTRTPKK